MAEELINLWRDWSLLAEEGARIVVKKPTIGGLVTRGNSCLVGKFMVDHFVRKEVIKQYLIKGWKPTETISLKVVGENMVLIDFEHFWDKSRALEERPWVFDGNLFFVEDFDGTHPTCRD
jgi:hypothetical protein